MYVGDQGYVTTRRSLPAMLLLTLSAPGIAQAQLDPRTLQETVAVADPRIALVNARVIDGTGAPAKPAQTVLIDHGKIAAVGDSAKVTAPQGTRTLDLTGQTILPGLIGMHEHLFYPSPGDRPVYYDLAFTAPLLYLACGVTTMRTGGSLEPYTDLNVKRLIESGAMLGPSMDVTGPYLQGVGGFSIQMPWLQTPGQAAELVDYWARQGVTSFKAYMNISHEALAAAIAAAHQRHLKVTGHLCSVGFREAVEMGIDNLEHGLVVDAEFVPGKKKNECPQRNDAIDQLEVAGPEIRDLISVLVQHKVAITSTLAVFEAFVPGRPPLQQRVIDALAPASLQHYLLAKERAAASANVRGAERLKKEMAFERAFVAAGGQLLAGCDPTGNGGALPGFGDQRNLELLVEAGFKPEEAVQIYSANAAQYSERAAEVGTIAPGKQADLVVVDGDPSARIADVEKVKYVFKRGTGYDAAKLLMLVRGRVGVN